MSQPDEIEIASQASLCDSEKEEELQKLADAEEEYDIAEPENLTTAVAAAEADEADAEGEAEELGSQDSSDESDDADKTDDSIVNDEIVYNCEDHDFCVSFAKEVDEFFLRTLVSSGTGKKERCAAIAEVLCDHYRKQ